MQANLRKLYSHFMAPKTKTGNRKCKAIVRNCDCGYHFKKGETICPECKQPRSTCQKWAIDGKDVCVTHGGHAGRSMTKGVRLGVSSFTQQQWDEIKAGMATKKREHEFVYQVATAAFKKIIEEAESPMLMLAAASEYFSKIAKYMQDIDQQQLAMTHIHTFDEIQRADLEKRIKEITNYVLGAALVSITTLMRKALSQEVYENIYTQIPQNYRDMMEKFLSQSGG